MRITEQMKNMAEPNRNQNLKSNFHYQTKTDFGLDSEGYKSPAEWVKRWHGNLAVTGSVLL